MAEKVPGKTGVPIKARAMMYKEVAQEVILYGSERWLVMYEMMTVLEGFHHNNTRRIVGMTARRGDGGEWE